MELRPHDVRGRRRAVVLNKVERVIDGGGRKVRRGDIVPKRGEAQSLGADAAGDVENGDRVGKSLRDDGVERRRLPVDTGVPIGDGSGDKMGRGGRRNRTF